MARGIRNIRATLLIAAALVVCTALRDGATGPVAPCLRTSRSEVLLASSFATADIAPTGAAGFPSQVYLFAGDLERAFDNAKFRPDAAIVPTNTDLQLTATSPSIQRVLVDRVRKQPAIMRICRNRSRPDGSSRPARRVDR